MRAFTFAYDGVWGCVPMSSMLLPCRYGGMGMIHVIACNAVVNAMICLYNPVVPSTQMPPISYKVYPLRPQRQGAVLLSGNALIRTRSTTSGEDHIVHDLVILRAFVRPDRLAVIRDVVYAESPVEPDPAVTRVRTIRGQGWLCVR